MTRASDTAKLLGAGATILDGTTISTADNTDSLILTSTDADASSGPNLNMFRNSSSPADNDFLGNVKFNGRNDNSQDVQYGELEVYAADVSDGTEDGWLNFNVMTGGSNLSYMQLKAGSGVVFNEDSNDIDFRVESNGNANMLFVDGGNDAVVIGSGAKGPNIAGLGSAFQIIGSSQNNSSMSLIATTNDADGSNIIGGKGRSTNGGQGTIVQNNDRVLNIRAAVDDGGDFAHEVGNIEFAVDATPGSNDTPGRIVFSTTADGAASPTERVRIDNSGRLLVGLTSPSGSAGAVLQARGTGASAAVFDRTNDGVVVGFKRNGGDDVGNISINSSSTAYNTSSDYRLKENVVTEWDATSRLKQLKPSRFNFIIDADNTVDGFLAHEVSSIVPEAISGEKDATEDITNVVLKADGTVFTQNISETDWEEGKLSTTDKDGNTVDPIYASDTTWVASKTVLDYQGIDQSKLVPLLVKTIQELEARITALES